MNPIENSPTLKLINKARSDLANDEFKLDSSKFNNNNIK